MGDTQLAENAPARILLACQQLETSCAQLYVDMARVCRSDRDAADFFLKMAGEEEQHGRSFDFLFKILDISNVTVSVDWKTVTGALESIEKIAGQVKGLEKCQLRDILRVAIQIEERLMGLHADMVAQVEDPQWLELFRGLVGADADHAEEFRKLERRRFP